MRALVIDNFAGGGGASTGIEAAIGRAIDVAINHDPEAVAMHAANHPATRHLCQSIMAVDPLDATGGAPVALAWFSPDCKHHSKAKGGKPREKHIRDLAWVVVHWAERLRKATPDGRGAPAVIMLENVEEFRQWGPLDADGLPIKERKGEEFDLWVRRLKRQGYRVEHRELRACDFGAPTSRKRLYLIARRDGRRIGWPVATHGKAGTPEVASGTRLPWRTAAECIDWSIPCPSIFTRARPLKEATLRRIAHGVMRYVVNAAQPFVVRAAHGDDGRHRTHPVGEPLGTQPASNEFATVDAAIVPITHTGGDRVHSTREPLRTVTTAKRGELAAVSATLVQTGYGERTAVYRCHPCGADFMNRHATGVRTGAPAECPICGEEDRIALVRREQAPRAPDLTTPLGTVVSGGGKHGLVTAFLSSFYTSNTNGGRGKADLPLKTVLAGGTHHGVVCAHMEQANTGMVGHPVGRPLSTIVSRGTQQRLVETTTVAADALPPELLDRAVQVASYLVKYYGPSNCQAVDVPLGTVTSKDRFAVVTVTIEAVTYVIVDIGMRMLTPRELARAQGFPDSYILDPVGPSGKPLTKSAQIRMIGNSVCPDVATALVRANLPELCAAPAEVAA